MSQPTDRFGRPYWIRTSDQRIDAPQVEILITVATVLPGYALARELHVSGPLAMVAIELLIGNEGRAHAMSTRTRERLGMLWQLLDEILNGVLFVLIGLEFAVIALTWICPACRSS
jgi:CPA1 family monovalent cation:H+ antiporter